MPVVKPITSMKQYEDAIGEPGVYVIIDFSATWYESSEVISPLFKGLAEMDKSGRTKYYEVDIDQVPDVAKKAGIAVMPTFVVLQNKVPVDQMEGAVPARLDTMVKKYQKPLPAGA